MDLPPEDEDGGRLPPGHVHSGIKEFRQNVYNLLKHGIEVPPPKKSRRISPTTAKTQAKTDVDDIFISWITLRQILTRREAVIRRRWVKKSKEQRKKILLTAWPNMPTRHRPDFQRVFDPSTQKELEDEDIFKWSHVNLEDLTQAKPLLLLLNSRGRSPPHVFAHVDQKSFFLGRQYGRISVQILSMHTMLLAGQKQAETYGKIVPLLNTQLHEDYLTNHCIHFNPTGGLLVLEVQRRLLRFLVECCHLILRDVPPATLTGLTLPELPEPEPLLTKDTSYLQLTQVSAEAPYRVPSKINTHRIKLLIEARRSAAEDYLWDLREDPGVSASVMLDYYNHCRENLPPAATEDLSPSDMQQMTWNIMVWSVLRDGYSLLIQWDTLSQKAKALDALTGNDLEQFQGQKQLPKPIEDRIIDMACILESLSLRIISKLLTAVPASADPGASFMGGRDKLWEPHREGFVKPVSTSTDPVLRMFGLLCDGRHSVINKIGLEIVVDEIQRMFDQQPAQKKRLSSFAAGLLSELALVSHIFEELTSIYPWAANFQELMRVRKAIGDNAAGEAECVRNGLVLNDLSPVILPLSKMFRYPVDKGYSLANVEALRQAEANLDMFWKEADSCLMEHQGKSLEDILRRNLQRPRELRRTPPWTPPHVSPPNLVKSSDGEILNGDFSALGIEPEKPGRYRPETPRVKTKTRGQLSPPKRDVSEDSEGILREKSRSEKPLRQVQVSARASKVFRTMLHTFGRDDVAQHEIDWKEFLHAMTSMGFAAEKLYGSVWHFTPNDPGMDRSIHFHEPHPSSKIPFLMARAFGRRFHRTYGWTGEMFAD